MARFHAELSSERWRKQVAMMPQDAKALPSRKLEDKNDPIRLCCAVALFCG